jgi:oligosaccharyltransferase complex subunit gamma
VHNWVAKHLPDRPHPPIKRPINWMRWISTFVILSGGLTASYVAWPYVLPVIQNRTVWAAITLISILLFTSGHMFNHIRNVPYVAGDGRGGVSYFASGFQSQYGLETQIVAAMCKSTHPPTHANTHTHNVYPCFCEPPNPPFRCLSLL